MKEIFDWKKAQMLSGADKQEKDLLTAIVKGAGVTAKEGNLADKKANQQTMSDDEIMGNAFIFLLAGHETTANSIHFCLIYLALNVSSQRHLQRDIDETFQRRPVSDWSYEKDLPKLFGNMVGAVLNEGARFFINYPRIEILSCEDKRNSILRPIPNLLGHFRI